MKLFIQIPCYNEEGQLPETLGALPRSLPGIDNIEILVIDDGSIDRTSEVARENGAHHVISVPKNSGLANAFRIGLENCLRLGADIIVNTDADNQYRAEDIQKLILPILSGKADFVIGSRPISEIAEFSAMKKFFQKVGSWVVRLASHTSVEDAPSGFRAFGRKAASRLHVFSNYTYTLETLIQAGQNGFAITSVPVRVNPQTRPSRLVRSNLHYIWRSAFTIVRIFALYKPLRFFVGLGCLPLCLGAMLGARFLFFYFSGGGTGHVQSLILTAILILIGISLWILGLLADLVSANRRLLENIDYEIRYGGNPRK